MNFDVIAISFFLVAFVGAILVCGKLLRIISGRLEGSTQKAASKLVFFFGFSAMLFVAVPTYEAYFQLAGTLEAATIQSIEDKCQPQRNGSTHCSKVAAIVLGNGQQRQMTVHEEYPLQRGDQITVAYFPNEAESWPRLAGWEPYVLTIWPFAAYSFSVFAVLALINFVLRWVANGP